MTLQRALLPVAAITLVALAWAAPASASPLRHATRPVADAVHQGVGIHAGVVLPVHPAPRRVAPPPRRRGHYEVRMERFWVSEEIVAYDVFGHPVVRPGYWAEREVEVWVPHRRRGRAVRRHHPRGGHVGFGVHIR